MSAKITLAKAAEMTSRYRSERENILVPELRGQNILALCETIDGSAVNSLLAQPECAKLRIYYGMYEDLTVHAVLVGVNENDEDILPAPALDDDPDAEGDIVNEGYRCPPICPPPSPLNG